ncbi:hypothetical protein LEP1GSC050_4203 [Leptospira broomii serovar Hurstbridge str. 5399]|uniref:Uncharacterized protein n=1 Tax=Leptospira broomii serovar Hurstbridge str. 5399 TaxID=1049789 RepID=T0F889_9LEPT|nr:hypothetical protein [Leptospira broomii]EQA44111.1 hypothetical protein LEP1GSC050_4203 [Leptospira broomii serovar Hurstbridge str. 5399]
MSLVMILRWNEQSLNDFELSLNRSGFTTKAKNTNSIEFEKTGQFVLKYFKDRLSYEANLYIERINGKKDQLIYLQDIAENIEIKDPVNDLDFWLRAVEEVCNNFDFYLDLYNSMAITYTKSVISEPFHIELKKAWERNDYAGVVKFAEKISDNLSEFERKAIAFSKQRLS